MRFVGTKRLRRAALVGLAVLAAVGATSGCQTVARTGRSTVRSNLPLMGPQGERRPGERPQFSAKQLEARGLEQLWDFYLGETISDMWLLDDGLYIYTVEQNLWAVDPADGRVLWKWEVPGGLSYPPGVYTYREEGLKRAPELFAVAKDVLWVLDRNVGAPMWSLPLSFAASSAPRASESHIYIGSWDGRVYAVSKDDRALGWWYRTGGAVTAPVAVAERSREVIMVASEDGVLYGLSPYADELKWTFRTHGELVAEPLNYKTYCYTVSHDMNLYKVRIEDGELDWRYATGSLLSQAPAAFGRDKLVLVTDEHRMLSLNPLPRARRNPLRWKVEGVSRWIAKGRRGVVAERVDGALAMYGDDDGKALWGNPLPTGADVIAQNPYSPKTRIKRLKRIATTMVLGYRDGWVVALREKRVDY